MSLKVRLYMHIGSKYPEWINGGELERLVMSWTRPDGRSYKASNASRRLRDLEEEGAIENRIRNGSVEYRHKPMAMKQAREKKVEKKQDKQLNLV